MIRQYELVERVKAYDPHVDEGRLNRAYVYAMQKHGHQRRASGDPYFSHPLEVAGILTDMKLDQDSIVTALLHDTLEDTDATYDEIGKLFGPDIARLTDGVTKLGRIEMQSESAAQAENFRKLLIAMSDDIRVLLVKLADRLHNMRTLHYIRNPDKRRRIARETMEIYAPLAERIGMQEMKSELEDLAFAELNPEARDSVLRRLKFLREKDAGFVPRIVDGLQATFNEAGIETEVIGREKTPYSIWMKMQRKNVSFEQLFDIMAFRVIVDSVGDCYQALGAVHGAYAVVPGRFKDYISTPKPNGYQSLHTGVFGPGGQRIELQIRTRDMDEIAERGVAAHWLYKQGRPATEGRQYRWLRELLDILDHANEPEEFLEHTKLEMFTDQVFCFTPKGDLIALPRGATIVDFAYAVHSEVGDHCVGGKINGRIMPLRTALKNGDQVDVITSKAQSPSPEWERFVVTGKARARIRRFVRSQERSQYLQLGRSMLQKVMREAGYELHDKALGEALPVFRSQAIQNADDLVAAVGEGRISAKEVLHAVYPATKQSERSPKIVPLLRRRGRRSEKKHVVPLRGLIPGMAVHFAGCCHPLPGDRIVGIVTTGKGVTIHTIDCETLESFADMPERWLDVGWQVGDEPVENFTGRLNVTVRNEPGSLSSLASIIAKSQGNISNLKITNRTADFFDMLIDVEVADVKHLNNIIAALRATPEINSVDRARG